MTRLTPPLPQMRALWPFLNATVTASIAFLTFPLVWPHEPFLFLGLCTYFAADVTQAFGRWLKLARNGGYAIPDYPRKE